MEKYQEVKERTNEYINIPNRAVQESFMMYNCIINSLTNSAKRQVRLSGKSFPFVIGGVGIGPMLLKVVIMVSHVDTGATISAVRTKLSSLDCQITGKAIIP
jgi:hypothetical protein